MLSETATEHVLIDRNHYRFYKTYKKNIIILLMSEKGKTTDLVENEIDGVDGPITRCDNGNELMKSIHLCLCG